MSWYCLADDVKLEDASRACLGSVDGVFARGKVLHGALPQNAALVVELHDASLYGLACLHVELAVLQAKGVVCGPPVNHDASVIARRT